MLAVHAVLHQRFRRGDREQPQLRVAREIGDNGLVEPLAVVVILDEQGLDLARVPAFEQRLNRAADRRRIDRRGRRVGNHLRPVWRARGLVRRRDLAQAAEFLRRGGRAQRQGGERGEDEAGAAHLTSSSMNSSTTLVSPGSPVSGSISVTSISAVPV